MRLICSGIMLCLYDRRRYLIEWDDEMATEGLELWKSAGRDNEHANPRETAYEPKQTIDPSAERHASAHVCKHGMTRRLSFLQRGY